MSHSHPRPVKIHVPEMTAHTARVGDEIVFRQTDSPIASSGYPGEMWSVEYRRPGVALPVAEAWVITDPYGEYIDWFHVMAGWRRQGIGTALFQAIRDREPDVDFDAVTEAGKEFVKGMSD